MTLTVPTTPTESAPTQSIPTQTTDQLRPNDWDEYIGQTALKSRLQTQISAAVLDARPLDHVLLTGPPGSGKTSLSKLIAQSSYQDFESVTMPIDSRTLARIVRTFEGVLLCDEIHRSSKRQQEELLPLLEFGYLQTASGTRLEASGLTVVGATTEEDKVIPPLRDRFPIKPHLDPYTDEEMGRIVQGMAHKAGVSFSDEMCVSLGKAAGGTPRNARQLVLAARDLYRVHGKMPSPGEILEFCRVDPDGLGVEHNSYLQILSKASSGTMGLRPLCSRLRLHESTVLDIERLLLERDFISYTDRGREMTQAGYRRVRS